MTSSWPRDLPRDAFYLAWRYRKLMKEDQVASAKVVLRYLKSLAERSTIHAGKG